jgi:hypothetical protein
MDTLESYLRAVKRCLPRAQSDDIIKELSDDLRSQLDEKQSLLGRPLSDDEVMEFFKHHGDPMTWCDVIGRTITACLLDGS